MTCLEEQAEAEKEPRVVHLQQNAARRRRPSASLDLVVDVGRHVGGGRRGRSGCARARRDDVHVGHGGALVAHLEVPAGRELRRGSRRASEPWRARRVARDDLVLRKARAGARSHRVEARGVEEERRNAAQGTRSCIESSARAVLELASR